MFYCVRIIIAFLSIILLSMPGFSMEQDNKDNSVQVRLERLEALSGGRLGLSAINMGSNQLIQYRENEYFPMGCTSKVIGVAAILKKSMKNNKLLQESITYKKEDLTNWNPITEKHLATGMTVAELCAAAISYSDNTAMNLLTKKLGGPSGLNDFARSIDDKNFKLDHWWPDEALATPDSKEDSTTPASMRKSLHKLVFGNILAKTKRDMLINWLKHNEAGAARIRAGVPKNWIVGNKTGTGFNYGITNDIAVIWPPHCAPIVITIYYSNSVKNAPKRDDIIASATRIVLDAYAKSDQCIKQQYVSQVSI